MQIVTNKKGATGYLVKEWNTIGMSATKEPEGGAFKIIATKTVIASCGKKQMHLKRITPDYFGEVDMGRNFKPETPIYISTEDADGAARELYEEFLTKSLARTRAVLAGNAETQSHYKWWPERKAEYENWIASLENRRIPLEIIYE